MISILIPVYNNDISKLTKDLNKQASILNIVYEILIFDDASTNKVVLEKNNKLEQLTNVKLLHTTVNFGRSKIRNLLADNATYNWLLFLDSNTAIKSDFFLKNYISHFDKKYKVIFGGIDYKQNLNGAYSLRYKYGKNRESKSLEVRKKAPHLNFTTKNFCIKKQLFDIVRFNENIKNYGYEDTLFSLDMKKINIDILHIDNEIYHSNIDTNKEFATKIQSSLTNLINYKHLLNTKDFKLLEIFNIIEKTYLYIPIGYFSKLFYNIIFNFTTKENAPLWYFDVYRILMLCIIKIDNKAFIK